EVAQGHLAALPASERENPVRKGGLARMQTGLAQIVTALLLLAQDKGVPRKERSRAASLVEGQADDLARLLQTEARRTVLDALQEAYDQARGDETRQHLKSALQKVEKRN